MLKLNVILALTGLSAAALDVDFSSRDSIRAAAALKAQDAMSYYHGHEYGQTPGILPGPPPDGEYFWWQAGALWGALIDYSVYTGDASYNNIVKDSLLFQIGPDHDYMPPNVSLTLGNDDQAFWGMAAMLAAESNFQNPPDSEPQWLALAQGVYNSQELRKDYECGGGLRWQVVPVNRGYDYKNSIANGAFFNMAARLARYTQDSTYADNARLIFEWMLGVGLIDEDYNVFDGAHTGTGCRDINRAQFSYNVAVLLQGAAFMWDITKDDYWRHHVNGLLDNLLSIFYRDGIAYEPVCDGPESNCNTDMKIYKSLNIRWMASAVQLCPWTKKRILPVLRTSAKAAVAQCIGGANGRMCGTGWWSETPSNPHHVAEFDGKTGLGQEMATLSALMTVLLIQERSLDTSTRVEVDSGSSSSDLSDPDLELDSGSVDPEYDDIDSGFTLATIPKPVTHNTGGTSKGVDPESAFNRRHRFKSQDWKPIKRAETIAAALLTSFMVVGISLLLIWMCIDGLEPSTLPLFNESVPVLGSHSFDEDRLAEEGRHLGKKPLHPRVAELRGKGKEREGSRGRGRARGWRRMLPGPMSRLGQVKED